MKNLKRFGVKYPMTCNYRPYTKEDKLEVGTKIRLAGREGEIRAITTSITPYDVVWDNSIDGDANIINLKSFIFEIEDISLPPLTIDKRVKEEIMRIMNPQIHSYIGKDLVDYLNSLEET